MQVRVFTVPVIDGTAEEEQLNRFLRGHRVLELVERFAEDGANSRWCLLVKYLDGKPKGGRDKPERIDYKDVLDEASFSRFCALRKARKRVAEEQGVPAFAIFTDKQMAELSKAETFNAAAMKQVDGLGDGKTEKYAAAIQAALERPEVDGPQNGDGA